MHVEPLNFSRLSVRTAELPFLSQMLARSSRFLALRSLAYEIDHIPSENPDPGAGAGALRLSEETHAVYSEDLASAIRGLLMVLQEKSGDAADDVHPGLRLVPRASRFPESSSSRKT